MKDKKTRQSNLELARIICILMIIVLHYNLSIKLLFIPDGSNFALGHFIESLCIIAVNTYVIITGYFSYEKTSVKISKIINLFFLSIFYGVVIFLGLMYIGKVELTADTFANLGSIVFSRWFLVIYAILYCLIPFINKLIKNLNEKQHRTLVFIGILFFYLWPSFFTDTSVSDRGYGITNFVILYLIGAYIAKYKDSKIPIYQSILIYLGCVLLTTIMGPITHNVYNYNNIINLIKSVAFFLIFKNIKMKPKKLINSLATYTFSTYIIHQNALLMPILYNDIFRAETYLNSPKLLINMGFTCLGIFVICVIIEFMRRIILKPIDKKIEKIKFEIECK